MIAVDGARTEATVPGLQAALAAAGLEEEGLPDVLVLPTPGGAPDPRVAPELAAVLTEDARSARGWHSHYDAFGEGHSFARRAEDLLAHDGDFTRRFLVERLSGIGIVR